MASRPEASDIEHAEACRACGGECCILYRYVDEFVDGVPGARPHNDGLDFEEYCIDWFDGFVMSGALEDPSGSPAGWLGDYRVPAGVPAPLHDPLRSHSGRAGTGEYLASLPDWVDTDRCQYCHPATGCLLPRERRPRVCREYACERLKPPAAG